MEALEQKYHLIFSDNCYIGLMNGATHDEVVEELNLRNVNHIFYTGYKELSSEVIIRASTTNKTQIEYLDGAIRLTGITVYRSTS